MSDSSVINLIKSLRDSQSAKTKMVLDSGREIHLDCIYKESIAPNFFAVFPPNTLPENLDMSKPCSISLTDENSGSIAITAKIVEIASDRSVELKATTTVDPISLREFFRVDLRTAIHISYETGSGTDRDRNWAFDGQTLDLSGSGTLGIFPGEPRNKHNIFIEIALTHPQQKMQCIGHVVRTKQLRKGRWQVALHFDNISQKYRDAIITNCLWEQRRQLRERAFTS